MKIIILSYRISGNDGVSLECQHWKKMLKEMGHSVTFLAGKLDSSGLLMPELSFQWPKVMKLHDSVVYDKGNYKHIEDQIFDVAGTIEGKLRKILNNHKKVDLLIVLNSLSLPMHFPMAVALKRVIEEFEIPTIARHNDFWWERKRYLKSHLFPFFEKWFPPDVKNIRHVVINSESQKQLKSRRGLDSEIISDSFDFTNNKLSKTDSYTRGFRKDFGISDTDTVFLQATRVIPRKRIELAIELMKKLNLPNAVLVIAGRAGDEGTEYEDKLKEIAKKSGARCLFIGERIDSKRRIIDMPNGNSPHRKKIYTLWDAYRNCDFVTYPTEIEGFGNQFIEAIYFKKPIVVTPYPVYKDDIAPLGFSVIEMTPKISSQVIQRIKNLIADKSKTKAMVEKNFEIGKKSFSYEATETKISRLFDSLGVK